MVENVGGFQIYTHTQQVCSARAQNAQTAGEDQG